MVITAAKVLAKGLARRFDLDIKRYVGEYGPDVYRNLFPEYSLAIKAFVNIGAGVARITTPNIRLYYEAYKRRDIYFNHHYQSRFPFGTEGTFSADRLSIWLVNEFATQLVQSAKPGHVPRFTDAQEVDSIFGRYATMEPGLDHFTAMVDFDLQRHSVGHHVS